MTAKYLEKIERSLEKSGLGEFVESMGATRKAVADHWSSSRLYWFTDHTETHSERVAAIAHRIASVRSAGKFKLTPFERYLLEMGSWLHDIGMQSTAPAGSGATKYPTDPDTVRKQHPALSFEAIVAGDFPTGIPSNHKAVIEFLALLAQSHGTHFYESSVAKLKSDFPTLMNRPVRGGLLAAILLMADELDLHQQRVPEEAAPQDFGPVSDAHWFKHECVEEVSLAARRTHGGRVQIKVRLCSFPNATDDVVASVRAWIEDKLMLQISKTEEELRIGFGGYFEFDKNIDFPVRTGSVSSKRLYPEMLAVIEKDNAEALLINHRECYEKCIRALTEGQSLAILGQSPKVSEDGREDLLRLLVLDLRSSNRRLLHLARSEAHPTLAPSDVLRSWLIQLDPAALSYLPAHEGPKAQELRKRLFENLSASDDPVILGLSSVDELSAETRDWLLGNVVAAAPGLTQFVMTTTRSISGFSSGGSRWTQVPIGSTPEGAIEKYLARFTAADEAARMAKIPMDYSQARRFAVLGSSEVVK